ncbi:MAG: DMT family transporter [Lautropia sp.]
MTPAPAPIPRWAVTAMLLAIATTFASNHVAARLAFDHGVSVPTAVVVRSLSTALVVFLLLRLTGASTALPRATLGRAVLIGLLITVQSVCLYSAVARLPVALALLTFNTFPLMLALLSWVAGGERPGTRTLVAMAVIVGGLTLALGVFEQIDGGMPPRALSGIAFGLGGAGSFAGVLFLTQRWLGAVDGRLRTVLMMTTAGIVTALVAMLQGTFAAPTDASGWLGLALLSLLYGTAITALFVLLPRVGAVNNSPYLNFEPIAAMILAWVLLGQQMRPTQVAGALVVVGAIVWLSLGHARPRAAAGAST